MPLPFDEPGVTSPPQLGRGVEVAFVVYGKPVQKGSVRAFVARKKGEVGGRAIVVQQNDRSLRDWEGAIRQAAQRYAATGFFLHEKEAVEIEFWFYFTRPQSKSKAAPMVVKPDYDKLARAVSDAIQTVLFKDDCQITDAAIHKRYVNDSASHVKVVVRRAHAT